MIDQSVVVAVIHGTSAVVGLLVGVALLRGRRTTTARGFATALLGGSVWSVAAAVGAVAQAPVRQALYASVVVPAVAVAVAGFACGVFALARVDWRPGRRALLLLGVHPVLALGLGATNHWHRQLVRAEPLDTVNALSFGPLFVAHSVLAYGILLGVAVLAVRARRTAPVLRSRQLTTVVAVGALPGIATGVQLVALPGSLLDLGAVAFVVVGLVDAQLIFRRSALVALPVARSTVLETIRDGILVVDESGVVIDANVAALELLARPGSGRPRVDQVVGRPVAETLGTLSAVVPGGTADEPPAAIGEAQGPLERRRAVLPGGATVVDLRRAPIVSAFGGSLGTVVVLRDVTADVAREAALAQANDELREHVATIERLRQEVAEQAVRDTVTGLYNRRHLDAVLAGQLERAADGGAGVALAIVDADHFKQVNDVHGHAAGDRVLEALADALTSGVAPGDVLVRYGGEEFVVVMTGVDETTAVARVEHLRGLCGAARAATRDGDVGVTVSAGLAFAGPGRSTPGSLLDAADAALYEAKRAGRARLRVAPPPQVADGAVDLEVAGSGSRGGS